jgi:Protein of unknown function (DUF3060)
MTAWVPDLIVDGTSCRPEREITTTQAGSAALAAALCIALVSACSSSPQAGGSTPSLPAPVGPDPRAIATSAEPTMSTQAADRTVRLTIDDEVELQRSHEVVSINCRPGGDIDLQADGVTLRAVGRCTAISVDGQNNTVTAEYADELSVDGSHNSVRTAGAGEADVDGSRNAVEVWGIRRTLDVQGTRNSVRYGGSPRTDIEHGNVVRPLTR